MGENTESRDVPRVRGESDWGSGKPRYQKLIWSEGEVGTTPAISYTESAEPIPDVPQQELNNTVVANTIQTHPDLFAIVSPFDLPNLRSYLRPHPNRPLVDSLLRGLEVGFWPYADTSVLPDDGVVRYSRGADDDVLSFLRTQRDEEIRVGRYSKSFGRSLLPGMRSQPVTAVPKPGSAKMRLINDHTALGGDGVSLNSIIPVGSGYIRLDDLRVFGANVRKEMELRGGQRPLWLFKSDASHAFRCLPMHPHWQARQATEVDGEYYVDRCAVFGNRASGRIWCLLLNSILWVAVYRDGLTNLNSYIDDVFGYDYNPIPDFYAPYNRHMPHKQAALLRIWDRVGVPHSDAKQLSSSPETGHALEIIGFDVSLASMTISLTSEKKDKLVSALREFVQPGRHQPTLREWLAILRWANWALNVFPLLKSALNSSWNKVRGKTQMSLPMWVNKDVIMDLGWFADSVEKMKGVNILGSVHWAATDADEVLYGDASDIGMAFYSPSRHIAYVYERDDDPDKAQSLITFFESLAVMCGIQWAASLPSPPRRLAIFSDSLNAVQIFSSFRARGKYAVIIMAAAESLMASSIDLRVFHIPGEDNIIADLLSRRLYSQALQHLPSLRILHFTPPQDVLGARLK